MQGEDDHPHGRDHRNHATSREETAVERLLLTADEAAQVLGLSRRMVYALLAAGSIQSVKIGGCRRIPADALREYVESLRECGGVA